MSSSLTQVPVVDEPRTRGPTGRGTRPSQRVPPRAVSSAAHGLDALADGPVQPQGRDGPAVPVDRVDQPLAPVGAPAVERGADESRRRPSRSQGPAASAGEASSSTRNRAHSSR